MPERKTVAPEYKWDDFSDWWNWYVVQVGERGGHDVRGHGNPIVQAAWLAGRDRQPLRTLVEMEVVGMAGRTTVVAEGDLIPLVSAELAARRGEIPPAHWTAHVRLHNGHVQDVLVASMSYLPGSWLSARSQIAEALGVPESVVRDQ